MPTRSFVASSFTFALAALTAPFALVALAGCGSEPEPSGGTGGGVPKHPDAVLAPPAEGEGFQIDEGAFQVESGREALYCKRFPIPDSYGDAPVYLRGVESRLPIGTHHFFMAYAEGALDAPEACVGSDPLIPLDVASDENHDAVDGKLAFTGAVGKDSYRLPDGYAVYLKTGLGHFTSSHHIFNLTDETASLYGVFNIFTAPEAEVKHPVNVLNCTLRDVEIPAHAEIDLEGTCTAPFDLDMVVLSSHAHQYTTRFDMRVFDGEKTLPEIVYESTQWDSPAIVPLEKPLSLKKGQGLTFRCHYVNNTDKTIGYGAGEFEEMCAIMSAYAYPADHPTEVPPTLGGVVFTAGAVEPLIDTSEIGGNF